ncbi:MAG: putative Ig domain-containing protein [Myxococcaceae bacterium]|nr:putative Ig domain-containing protein [Myxococcaceae bacterium]
MKNVSLAVLAVLVVSSEAAAQLPPFTRTSQPYTPITGGTALSFSNSDEGVVPIQLPFGFPYNGATYQTVYVHVNGQILVTLPSSCTPGATSCTTFTTISPIPTPTGSVQNHISAFWDDAEIGASTVVRVLSTPAKVTVEWANLEDFSNQWTASFQIALEPSGNFSIHYGAMTGTSASGVAGYQAGSIGYAVLGATCSPTLQSGCCGSASNTARCTNANYVADTLISTEPPLSPDLIAQSVRVSNFQTVQPSNDLSMTVTVRANNYSRSPANNWSWRAFLSPDPFRDPPDGGPGLPDGGSGANDIPLDPESSSNSLTPQGQQDFTANVTTSSPPPAGDYFVIVQLDTQNAVAEVSEVNNVAILPYAITGGVDLVSTAITGVPTSGPDAVDPVRLQYFNRGGQSAGTLDYRILLSATRDAGLIVYPDGGSVDLLPDGGEGPGPVSMRLIHRGTRAVTGGETVDEMVNVTMPPDAPQGEYFYVLQIDPAGLITEANERNNVVFSSGRVDIKRADLLLEAIDVIDVSTRVPVRSVLFGEQYKAVVRFRNQGGGAARNYRIGVILSTDSTLSLLSDLILAEEIVAQTQSAMTSTTLEIPFTLPLVDRVDAGLPSGNYYVFVSLDTLGVVVESNKGNNSANIGPVRALSPAPDYALSALQAPASAGIGEVIPVFRTIRNIGNRPAPQVPYRFFASANTIITTSDVPLEIQLGDGGVSLAGDVALPSGGGDSRTELVKLPAGMPPGQYYVGCVVDPANTLVELNKANNSFSSNPVQVVQSSLRILDVQLPDSTVGRSYFYRLSASGEEGASTWAVDASQGALPPGLTLSPSGDLTGTPSGMGGTGVRAFTVTLTNNGRTASARLVMRVLPPTSQVEITTASIPAIVNSPSAALQFPLGAAGGSRPYSWRVAQGTLPPGITFNVDGVLGGAPRAGTPDGVTRVTFEVRDATGGATRRELQLRLVAAGSIVLRTTRLPDAVVGQDFMPTEIAVANADNSMLARPLVFTVSGNLPPGLLSQEEFGVFTISGRPTRAGTFTFTISVEDARGRSDSLDYTVTVYTTRFRIVANNLPQLLRPNDPVSATFATQPGGNVTWSVVSGRLPPGITLTPAGSLEGTVEDLDASIGTFTFVVEAKDDAGANGLAPYALVVERAPRRMGCSTTDAGPLGLLALGLLGLLRAGRRRVVPVLAAAAVAVPAIGLAQQPYQSSTPAPLPYQPLPSSRTVVSPSTLAGARVALPFTFRFYGTAYTEVSMGRYGYLGLGGADAAESFNTTIPHNSSFDPATIIAPWWDSLFACPTSGGTCSSSSTPAMNYAWTVTGSAPNRVAVFEWRDQGTSSSTAAAQRFSFQVHLFETSNQVRFSYGPSTPPTSSASVGIMGARMIGLAGLPCTTGSNCSSTDWPTSQAIDFFLPADLRIARLAVDQTGYSGVRYGATAFVRNDGGRLATNVTVRFYLSTDAILEPMTDTLIGDATGVTVPVGDETAVSFPGNLPMTAMPGNYFVLAEIDPANAVPELDENNNQSPPSTMTIGSPKADLTASGVTAPASAAPGGTVMVSRTLSNVGNAAAPAFKFTWLLSDNNVISISDRALSPVGNVAGLAPAAVDMGAEMLALPANLAPGTYWLGVCVNFDGANATSPFPVDEIAVVNNCAVAAAGTVVSTGSLTVLTTSLPPATQYAPYGLRLRSTGGSGVTTWAVTAGALPPGMALSSDGTLSGGPARTGSFGFEVTATSGTATAAQMLSLMVSPGTLPLVIVDQDLPGAEFGRTYSASLIAIGGKPPYTWALRSNAVLPEGLALSGDGFLEGRATESGEKAFEVEVTDTAGARVARELKIRVVNPTSLSIGTTALVRGVLRQSYLQRLVVVGGRAPYQWTVTRFQQLPQNPTESPGPVQMGLPENFGLSIQDGVNEDFLSGTPKQAGMFSLNLKVVDGAGTEDTVSLTLMVAYSEALAITTTILPDAFINQSYAVKLSHNGGRDSMVSFSLPCIRQATRPETFECVATDPTQTLPPGLSLGSDGSILGIPSPIVEPGTFTFLVKATDEAGRQDIRGLSIRLQPDFAAASQGGGGCSAAAGLPLALGALALFLTRRRRP